MIGSPVSNPTKKRRIALLASSTRSPSDFVWPLRAPRGIATNCGGHAFFVDLTVRAMSDLLLKHSGRGEDPMASDTGSSSRLIVGAATAAVLSFALLLPANAQFWGNSWGGRQQQPQQPYNPYAQQRYNPYAQQPYGGYGGDHQWGYGGYPQRERSSSPRQRERPREVQRERPRDVEKEQPPDYSHAPPATPRKDATVKVVVMGDANADWLAFGLEDAFSENPEIGIVQAPHAFYNHDPMQVNLAMRKSMPDDQRFFFEAIMPSRDG